MAAGTTIAKAASTVLGSKKLRKKVGNVLTVIIAPLVALLVLICSFQSGGADHNAATVEAVFFAKGVASETVPAEFKSHVEDMTGSFVTIDSTAAQISRMMENGSSLDATRVKAVFYSLFFGSEQPSANNISAFVNCFVRYEQRTAEDGTTYTVAVPIADMETVYANISSAFGMEITDADRKNSDAIYSRIHPAGDNYAGDVDRGDGSGTGINTGTFSNPAGKNSADLVAYAKNAYENSWGYVWGTFGDVLTDSLFQYKLAQYPDGVGRYADFIRANWLGRRTTDCVGLIKGYGWLNGETQQIVYGSNGMPDVSADQMYNLAVEKGNISTIPEIPGLAVWHKGHIGVYIGNGEVIEAMGTKYGVVKTKLADRNFTAWLKIPYISYD